RRASTVGGAHEGSPLRQLRLQAPGPDRAAYCRYRVVPPARRDRSCARRGKPRGGAGPGPPNGGGPSAGPSGGGGGGSVGSKRTLRLRSNGSRGRLGLAGRRSQALNVGRVLR